MTVISSFKGMREDILCVLPLSYLYLSADDKVKQDFGQHCQETQCYIWESQVQYEKPRQSVEPLIIAVYGLAEHSQFGALRDELIRYRTVVGLLDRKFSERLQLDAELTLAKAIQCAWQNETVTK